MIEPVFTYDWQTPNFPTWERVIAGRSVREFLEIGCFEGRSTLWLLNKFPFSFGTCIDTFEGGEEHDTIDFSGTRERFLSNLGRMKDARLSLYVETSEAALSHLSPRRKEAFDLVLIDGSHIAKNVLQDAVFSWPMLRHGGILVFDDYAWGNTRPPWSTPKPAIDAFMACYLDQYRLIEKGYQVIVEKV